MGRRQKGARQQSIVAYFRPRAPCRSGVFYLKPLKAIEARAALFDSAFHEVEPQLNHQSHGDRPAPLTHVAEILKLLQQRVGALDIPAVRSNSHQHDIRAQHALEIAGRIDDRAVVNDHGLGFIHSAMLVADACDEAGGNAAAAVFGPACRSANCMASE
jgi:hypothetical protein